jgi:hypothetical protein
MNATRERPRGSRPPSVATRLVQRGSMSLRGIEVIFPLLADGAPRKDSSHTSDAVVTTSKIALIVQLFFDHIRSLIRESIFASKQPHRLENYYPSRRVRHSKNARIDGSRRIGVWPSSGVIGLKQLPHTDGKFTSASGILIIWVGFQESLASTANRSPQLTRLKS